MTRAALKNTPAGFWECFLNKTFPAPPNPKALTKGHLQLNRRTSHSLVAFTVQIIQIIQTFQSPVAIF